MCKILGLTRSQYYYPKKALKEDKKLDEKVKEIFKKSRNNYGGRKIKKVLERSGTVVSRRKVRRVMIKLGLVSKYTEKNYKVHKSQPNNAKVENIVNREFSERKILEVVVSDLTYVKVGNKWNYICTILDISNREIIGYAAGRHKDALLVESALISIKGSLDNIQIFHTDRGSEFKNKIIDNFLKTFDIKRSLSRPGNPYDNAVAEATFKTIKTELVYGEVFESFEALEMKLFDYVNWYNNHRLHSSLGYKTPIEYKALRDAIV